MAVDPKTLVFYIALLFLASYIAGRMYDRLRVNRMLLAFSEAVKEVDPKARVRRLGPRIIVFSGERLTDNVGRYSINVFTMGRENPFSWLIARLAGRDDMVVLRARVKGGLAIEVDAVKKGTYAEKGIKRVKNKALVGGYYFITGKRRGDRGDHEVIAGLLAEIEGLVAFSLRKRTPELVVTLTPNGVRQGSLDKALRAIDKVISYAKGDRGFLEEAVTDWPGKPA